MEEIPKITFKFTTTKEMRVSHRGMCNKQGVTGYRREYERKFKSDTKIKGMSGRKTTKIAENETKCRK